MTPVYRFRHWLGRTIVHAGIRCMPDGKVKDELLTLLLAWSAGVNAIVLATQLRSAISR